MIFVGVEGVGEYFRKVDLVALVVLGTLSAGGSLTAPASLAPPELVLVHPRRGRWKFERLTRTLR